MSLSKQFYITSRDETVLPVTYIERYKDETIQDVFRTYKFASTRDKEYVKAKDVLASYILDIILHIKTDPMIHPDTTFIFTSPPSTMYARGEKSEDSMRELLRQETDFYTKVFSVKRSHIKQSKAQHLASSRKKRLANMSSRYSVSWSFRCKLLYSSIKRIQIVLIDDVCSTGGTLLACKQTLEQYMQKHPTRGYKKKPEVSVTIQVFSIAH